MSGDIPRLPNGHALSHTLKILNGEIPSGGALLAVLIIIIVTGA